MMIQHLFILALTISYVSSRDAKWLFNRGTVTKYLHQMRLVTNVVPSSCIVIDPSLPNCRNVRRMDVAPSQPTKILATATPESFGPRSVELESGEERADSWGYNWGWGQETVVKTVVATQTVKEVNPDAVVSIVFKGCQPTSLPFSLSTCSDDPANATHQMKRELHYTTD